MGLFTWIKGLLQPQKGTIRVNGGYQPLAFAEGRRQAQSFQIPPRGADPVATDEELLKVLDCILWADDARRALYARGRADERTAILRALGVEP
jgi:hypothetical protein